LNKNSAYNPENDLPKFVEIALCDLHHSSLPSTFFQLEVQYEISPALRGQINNFLNKCV